MKLPAGYVPGVGVLTNSALGGFGQKMLEKMGWKKGEGLGRDKDGVTEALEVKNKQDTAGLGVKKGQDWATKSWEVAYSEALAAVPQGSMSGRLEDSDSDGEGSFQTARGELNTDGTRTTATTEELKIHSELARHAKGHWAARKGKLARIRKQEEQSRGITTAGNSGVVSIEDTNQDTFYDAKSSVTDTESNGAAVEIVTGAFGSPVVDEAAGFGSPICIASSGDASPDQKTEQNVNSAKVSRAKSKKSRKKRTAEEAQVPLDSKSQRKRDDQNTQPNTHARSSARKRKQVVQANEYADEEESQLKKQKGRKKTSKGKEAKKQTPKKRSRLPEPQRKARVAQVFVADDPYCENGEGSGFRGRSPGKRPREHAKTRSSPRRRRLKLDKKAKRKAAVKSGKRGAGALQPKLRKSRKLQNEPNPTDVRTEDV